MLKQQVKQQSFKLWRYLTTGQFDSRSEGAARVLTFGGVKAVDIEEEDANLILCVIWIDTYS